MKIKILKKTQKDGVSASGVPYTIRNLFVSFEDAKLFEKIKNYLREKQGATNEQIDKFIKESNYKDQISYVFGLNCSYFTFENVEQFGILDADIEFKLNDSGYINANIRREKNKEVVNGYTPSENSNVDGWTNATPVQRNEVEDLRPIPSLVDVAENEPFGSVEKVPFLPENDPENELPF